MIQNAASQKRVCCLAKMDMLFDKREEIECSLKTLYLLTSRFDRKLCSRGNKNGYNFLYSI